MQRKAIDRQDGLTHPHYTSGTDKTEESDMNEKEMHSSQFPDSLQLSSTRN